MMDQHFAFKQLGAFDGFLEKVNEKMFFSEYDNQLRQYCYFCHEVVREGALDYFTGTREVDQRLSEALFLFWWYLNVIGPKNDLGSDLWPSLYKIARAWIVPSPPKGTGSKSHSARRNIQSELSKITKSTNQLLDDIRIEKQTLSSIYNALLSAHGNLLCAKLAADTLVQSSRTSYHYEREGAQELIKALGNKKSAYNLIRLLFKILPEFDLVFQKNAKGWPARISKQKNLHKLSNSRIAMSTSN